MATKKDKLVEDASKIKDESVQLKEKKKVVGVPKSTKKEIPKETKSTKKEIPKETKSTKKEIPKETKSTKKEIPKETKSTKKETPESKPIKKAPSKEIKPIKKETPAPKEKKLTKKELEEIKKEAEKTLEEELEEQLTDEEIENFQIEKVDMERLTNKICDILAEHESEGMFQSELWKKLKLTNRDGSRLALKLERMGTIYREKLLEKGRWTYKLILKKTPISTLSIENAPCLVCPVEQKCSLEGEISPRSCQFIEDWVLADMKKPANDK
jgi:hypothetical protein